MGKRVCKEYDVRIGKQDHGPVRYRRELSNPLGLFSGDVLQISFGIVQDVFDASLVAFRADLQRTLGSSKASHIFGESATIVTAC